jgi:hypothetical protein
MRPPWGRESTFRERQLVPGWFPQAEAALGYVYARAGNRSHAEQILAGFRTRRLTQYVSPIDVAQVCLGLGDIDSAMTVLEEGYRTRTVRMVIIGDPFFSELAPDARYRQLMTRLRLPIPG